jgi:hypothetical protein
MLVTLTYKTHYDDELRWCKVAVIPLCEFVDQTIQGVRDALLKYSYSSLWYDRNLRCVQHGDIIKIGDREYEALPLVATNVST